MLVAFKSNLIFFLLLSTVNSEDQYYAAIDTSYAGVSSSQEFTNGAQDNGTGILIGYKFTEYSFELTYRKYNYLNSHYSIEDSVEIVDDITDTYVALGIRGQHNSIMESKFGFSINSVEGKFIGLDGTEYYSPVDGVFFGMYFGTGPKFTLYEVVDLYFDFTLRKISSDIFTVGYDIGLRYFF